MKKQLVTICLKHQKVLLVIGMVVLTMTMAIIIGGGSFWLAFHLLKTRTTTASARHLTKLVLERQLLPSQQLADSLAQESGGHIVLTTPDAIVASTLEIPANKNLIDGETILIKDTTYHVALEYIHVEDRSFSLWLLLPEKRIVVMLCNSAKLQLLILVVDLAVTVIVVFQLVRVFSRLQTCLHYANPQTIHPDIAEMLADHKKDDVHNPLAGIKMDAKILAAGGSGNADLGTLADGIVSSMQGLEECQKKLAELSKGNVSPQLATMPLRRLLVHIEDMFRETCRQAEVTLVVQIDTAIGDTVSSQWPALQLRQVLINLITNAVEASPKGGIITVTAKKDDKLTLCVCDEGPGVHPRDGEDIFAPFVSHKEKGSGMGLFICRKITAANHGTLTWQNNPQKGVTFTLVL